MLHEALRIQRTTNQQLEALVNSRTWRVLTACGGAILHIGNALRSIRKTPRPTVLARSVQGGGSNAAVRNAGIESQAVIEDGLPSRTED